MRDHIPEYMKDKKIAILGYNTDGEMFARLLRENNIEVYIGLRPIDDMWSKAEQDGFSVLSLWDAVKVADIIQVW
jgi:ketol-acid reductoisomerase